MKSQEEVKRWILEHPDEAKKIFNDFVDWFGDIGAEMARFLNKFAQAFLQLYENAVKQDKTGKLKMRLEEVGFVVNEDGKIMLAPKKMVKRMMGEE